MAASTREFEFPQVLIGGAVGAGIALLANYALYGIAVAAGVSFVGEFQPGTTGPLPVPAVGFASVLPVMVGAILLGVLARFSAKPSRYFVPFAVVFSLLSFFPPMSIANADLATRLVLTAMHVTTPAAALFGYLRFGRSAP